MAFIDLLPEYYQNNDTMKELQSILETDTGAVSSNFDKVIDECFICTSASLLSRYETIYGLKVDISKDAASRRNKIISKLIGIGTLTKQVLKQSIEAYPYCDNEIIEDNASYRFYIKFNNVFRVPEASTIIEAQSSVEVLKPAHLTYLIDYEYDWWGHVNGTTTWGTLTTWADFREY
jgi:hypothetical protein